MNLKRNRMISTIGLSAVLGSLAPMAIAADGDGLERLAQTRAGDQRIVSAVQAPAAQGVSDQVRLQWIPAPDQLNVPGNPAFGRVMTK
jgi:hypothetical protein